ncbi:MAG: iron(III) transport system ATP-binding protein [Solirubrobacteraceae bacterium]|nr:iron(III) transport system ATP-binding protein [Solirubrobacteraceae bacterium]
MASVELHNVTKRFGATVAADRVSLSVPSGEFVALLGPSGCGKTTLLRLIAGFMMPDEGAVVVGGQTVAGPTWVPPERRRVGMVFQDYALFPHLTVAENVGFGLPRRRRAAGTAEALALVGLDRIGGRYPHELSGGQQQRVALARALAPEPTTVLLDEPWSNIDPLLRGAMRDDIARILRTAGVTAVLVTHDQEEAFSLADRIALMDAGRIAQVGTPEDMYYRPASRRVAEFVGATNFVAAGSRIGTSVVEEDGAGDVLVRPELVGLTIDPAGGGTVVGREFRGHDVFYKIDLGDGDSICSHRPSNEVVPLGARVRVELYDGPVKVFS